MVGLVTSSTASDVLRASPPLRCLMKVSAKSSSFNSFKMRLAIDSILESSVSLGRRSRAENLIDSLGVAQRFNASVCATQAIWLRYTVLMGLKDFPFLLMSYMTRRFFNSWTLPLNTFKRVVFPCHVTYQNRIQRWMENKSEHEP